MRRGHHDKRHRQSKDQIETRVPFYGLTRPRLRLRIGHRMPQHDLQARPDQKVQRAPHEKTAEGSEREHDRAWLRHVDGRREHPSAEQIPRGHEEQHARQHG